MSTKKTILLAEDDDSVRRVCHFALHRHGFDIIEGENAAELLNKLSARRAENPDFKPDLLLTDMQMPGMNGLNLARHLRVIYPNLPVVFMSGDTEERLLALGIAEVSPFFLLKGSASWVQNFFGAITAALKS